MNAGELNCYIEIECRKTADNPLTGTTEKWGSHTAAWAKMKTMTGNEVEDASQVRGLRFFEIETMWTEKMEQITPAMRVRLGRKPTDGPDSRRTLNITWADNVDAMNRVARLRCTESF